MSLRIGITNDEVQAAITLLLSPSEERGIQGEKPGVRVHLNMLNLQFPLTNGSRNGIITVAHVWLKKHELFSLFA